MKKSLKKVLSQYILLFLHIAQTYAIMNFMSATICPICKKEIEENSLFWLFEQEKVNKFLESEIFWVKICPEHNIGLEQYANLLKKRWDGIEITIQNG